MEKESSQTLLWQQRDANPVEWWWDTLAIWIQLTRSVVSSTPLGRSQRNFSNHWSGDSLICLISCFFLPLTAFTINCYKLNEKQLLGVSGIFVYIMTVYLSNPYSSNHYNKSLASGLDRGGAKVVQFWQIQRYWKKKVQTMVVAAWMLQHI